MKNIIILLTAMMYLTDCKTVKNPTESVVEKQAEITLFTVSFISKGSGPDAESKTKYNAFIESFQEQNSIILNYTKTNWGKEGETDYCFDLSTVKSDVKGKFIIETKNKLSSSKLVRYAENTSCRVANR